MPRFLLVLSLLALASGVGLQAATYTVTNTDDSGAGSLRWALGEANSSIFSDTVTFSAALSGSTICPRTPLPALEDDGTTLDGDLDDNGTPDITINGRYLSAGEDGLTLIHHPTKSGCTIRGLAITNCPRYGIYVNASWGNHIYGCHLGVNRVGRSALVNGDCDVYVYQSQYNTIGGDEARERNVIAGGSPSAPSGSGIYLDGCSHITVSRNYFGLNRAGDTALTGGPRGVYVVGGSENVIGGGGSARRNVFAVPTTCLVLRNSTYGNVVSGNYFGLAADGATLMPFSFAGVALQAAAHDNTVGGTTSAARNVFAGGNDGDCVRLDNAGTDANVVQGNYFGLTADGTQDRDAGVGVMCLDSVGALTIGGSAAGARNYFCGVHGVILRFCGGGTVIRNNTFGARPDGTAGEVLGALVEVDDVSATVADNLFANGYAGLDIQDAGYARVVRNTFRDCNYAVWLEDDGGRVNLGNLANTSTADDGGNVFRRNNTWYVYNGATGKVKAEGNTWGSTVGTAIDAKIYDRLDDATRGRVDYDPLAGGVAPADLGPALAVTGASALSTASGAEIAFTLSAPAAVSAEVLNLAGRPVAPVAADRPSPAGLQRLTWGGCSARGLRVPSGRYLIRISACDATGRQAHALASVTLNP